MVVEQRRKEGGSSEPPAMLGSTAVRPPDRKGLEAVRYCLHNPDTGTYIGRTPKHWAQLLLFFSIYYLCLAAFWYAMLNLFFLTVPEDRPKYVLEESLIGVNPGVGVVPGQSDDFMDSAMILLEHKARQEDEDPEEYEKESNMAWAKRVESFLARYSNTTNTRDCGDSDEYNTEQEACRFDVGSLGECGTFPYGYFVEGGAEVIEPCVYFKLNKIFAWEPEPYAADTDFEEPKRDYTSDEEAEDTRPPSNVQEAVQASTANVYIDCQGIWPADREALVGKMQYYPSNQGLPFRYFPYVQTKGNYHAPLVAVKFKDLPAGQLLHIECRAWYKGAVHIAKERSAMTQFELILQ